MEERGVEHRDVRQIRQRPAGDLDTEDGRRVVQGRQRLQLPDPVEHRVVDDGGQVEIRAAVDHPVADRDQLHGVEVYPLCGDLIEGDPQCLVVIGDTAVVADSLDDPVEDAHRGAGLHQLVFQR